MIYNTFTNFIAQTAPIVNKQEIIKMYEQIDSILPQNSGQRVVIPDFEPLQNFAGAIQVDKSTDTAYLKK